MIGMKGMFSEFQIIDPTKGKSTQDSQKKTKDGLSKNEVMKNGRVNGARVGGKGGALNMDALKKTASKYATYQQDYIDAYINAFNRASKSSSLESTIKAKAKHNGTSAACKFEYYDEKRLKKSAEKFGELSSVYYDSYVKAFNLKREKVNPSTIKKPEKVPSVELKAHSDSSDSSIEISLAKTKRLNILIDALDALSEFEVIDVGAVEDNNCPMVNKPYKSNKTITPHHRNSQIESDSSSESSSDSEEEFSFARIKRMRNL